MVDFVWMLKRWKDGWLKIKEMRREFMEDWRDRKMVDKRLKRWVDGW